LTALAANDEGGRSTKEDWLNHAIRALVEQGIDHVKVQVIARELNVSRSSFYWFFESLKDLHDQLLDHWLRINTGPIIERANRPAPSINRLWARRSDEVKSVVRLADSQRLEAVTSMFRRYGYQPEDALIRARVLYFTQVGHYVLEVDEDLETRHGHVAAYLKSFSGVDPTAEDIEISRRFTFRMQG
jgi:AcrR family transcriptional regulator